MVRTVISYVVNLYHTSRYAPSLSAGQSYEIKLEYFDNFGGAVARLLWSSPSTPKAVVPRTALFSSAAATAGASLRAGAIGSRSGPAASSSLNCATVSTSLRACCSMLLAAAAACVIAGLLFAVRGMPAPGDIAAALAQRAQGPGQVELRPVVAFGNRRSGAAAEHAPREEERDIDEPDAEQRHQREIQQRRVDEHTLPLAPHPARRGLASFASRATISVGSLNRVSRISAATIAAKR